MHGQSEQAVKGGASGAIVVDGIENLQPLVAGLPERILIVRDQTVAGDRPTPGGAVPTSDVTLNYVPIAYPALAPATIAIRPGQREFWRVLNASAETVLDIAARLRWGRPAAGRGRPRRRADRFARRNLDGRDFDEAAILLIPAAGRAEFIVAGPTEKVRSASLVTSVDRHAGQTATTTPRRTLAVLRSGRSAGAPPASTGAARDAERLGRRHAAALSRASLSRTDHGPALTVFL